MLNTILNITGIIIIVYSMAMIKKEERRIDKTKEFPQSPNYASSKDGIEKFNKLLEKEEKKIKNEKNQGNQMRFNASLTKDIKRPLNKKDTIESVGYSGIIRDARLNKNKEVYRNNEILKLKQNGYEIIEIAKKTGRSIREIEVILKLFTD